MIKLEKQLEFEFMKEETLKERIISYVGGGLSTAGAIAGTIASIVYLPSFELVRNYIKSLF